MLVLSRKQKQQIRIGDNVVVTVLQIKGGSVRIGIEAPREIHVMRGELEDFHDSVPMPTPNQTQPEEPREHDILTMTNGGAESNPQSSNTATVKEQKREVSPKSQQRILELKFEGGSEEEVKPTRLAEIASTIPSLNLPR